LASKPARSGRYFTKDLFIEFVSETCDFALLVNFILMKNLLIITFFIVLSLEASAQLPNTGMENWRKYTVWLVPFDTLESPNNWYTADSLVYLTKFAYPDANPKKQVYKSTDKHGGSYAAMLRTRTQDSIGTVSAVLSNAELGIDLATVDPSNPLASITYTGGTPITQRISNIQAWIKYLPKLNDTGYIVARAVRSGAKVGGGDSIIGSGYLYLTSSPNYTQVTVPINYINSFEQPNNLLIAFLSSNMEPWHIPVDSSLLFVDDVSMTVNGIEETLLGKETISVFPNPSTGTIHLQSNDNQQLTGRFYNLTGQEVRFVNFKTEGYVDLSGLPQGYYLYTVSDKNEAQIQKGMVKLK
jgi:hypothetical protein